MLGRSLSLNAPASELKFCPTESVGNSVTPRSSNSVTMNAPGLWATLALHENVVIPLSNK